MPQLKHRVEFHCCNSVNCTAVCSGRRKSTLFSECYESLPLSPDAFTSIETFQPPVAAPFVVTPLKFPQGPSTPHPVPPLNATPTPPQLRHAENLQPVTDLRAQPTLLAVAVHFPARDRGRVRLIDNTVLEA